MLDHIPDKCSMCSYEKCYVLITNNSNCQLVILLPCKRLLFAALYLLYIIYLAPTVRTHLINAELYLVTSTAVLQSA